MNYEIRKKKISRSEARKIVERYDGVCDQKFIDHFCNYLEISKEEFWKVISNQVNRKLFTLSNKKNGNKYLPKFKVGEGL